MLTHIFTDFKIRFDENNDINWIKDYDTSNIKKIIKILSDVAQRETKRAKDKFDALNDHEISREWALRLYKKEYESLEKLLKLLQTRKDLDRIDCVCGCHKHLTGPRGFETEMNLSMVGIKIMVLLARLFDMDEGFGVDFHCNGADEFNTMLTTERKEAEKGSDIAGDVGDRIDQRLTGRNYRNSNKESREPTSFIFNIARTTPVESQGEQSAHLCCFLVCGYCLVFVFFCFLLAFFGFKKSQVCFWLHRCCSRTPDTDLLLDEIMI